MQAVIEQTLDIVDGIMSVSRSVRSAVAKYWLRVAAYFVAVIVLAALAVASYFATSFSRYIAIIEHPLGVRVLEDRLPASGVWFVGPERPPLFEAIENLTIRPIEDWNGHRNSVIVDRKHDQGAAVSYLTFTALMLPHRRAWLTLDEDGRVVRVRIVDS